jgi:hypothetical protein
MCQVSAAILEAIGRLSHATGSQQTTTQGYKKKQKNTTG